ncbi:BAR domain family protein [Candida albicans]|uniref:BAR domain family protein n=1 Tax=Candida albicans TaxID=5476 RepID=A0A8H6F300_CANAX|nr:BAR domain family protein [Candida albicans]
MSWIGIKKAINRAGTQVMLKTGHIEQTIDKEYEFQEKRYRTMEENSIKLQKNLRLYLDSLRLLTNSQINIAESLNSFYGTNNDKRSKYYATIKQLNDSCIANLENPYNQTVLNPIARFNSYYIEINEIIKKRHNKLLDYDAMKNKLRKLIENPTTNISPSMKTNIIESNHNQYEEKLKIYNQELTEVESKYVEINNQLLIELPKLINHRISYFDPSFESFVKIQLRFFNENYHVLNQLQLKLDAQTRQDYIEGKLEDRIDDVLRKMKKLDITSGLD